MLLSLLCFKFIHYKYKMYEQDYYSQPSEHAQQISCNDYIEEYYEPEGSQMMQVPVKEKIIEDQKIYPDNHIGQTRVTYKVGKGIKIFSGTGILIRNNIVLTCAHNIYKSYYKDKDGQTISLSEENIESFSFTLGGKVVKVSDPNRWYVPQEFKNCKGPQRKSYDYAFIRLDHPFNLTTKLFLFENYEDTQRDFKLIGYYRDSKNKVVRTDERVQVLEFKQDEGILYCRADTQQGNSGSPILLLYQRFYLIIGIHIGAQLTTNRKITKYFNNKMSMNLKRLGSRTGWDEITRNLIRFKGVELKVDQSLEEQFRNLNNIIQNKKQLIQEYKKLYELQSLYLFQHHNEVLRKAKLPQTLENYNKLIFLKITRLFYYTIESKEINKYQGSFIYTYKYGKYLYDCLNQFKPRSQHQIKFQEFKNHWGQVIAELNDQNTIQEVRNQLTKSWPKIFQQSLEIIRNLPVGQDVRQFFEVYCKIAVDLCDYQKKQQYLLDLEAIIFNHIKMLRLLQFLTNISDAFSKILDKVMDAAAKIIVLIMQQQVETQIEGELQKLAYFSLQSTFRQIIISESKYISLYCPKNSQLQKLVKLADPSYYEPSNMQELVKLAYPSLLSNLRSTVVKDRFSKN